MTDPIGYASHIILCQGTSGSGTSVTYDSTLTSVYIKCPEPEFEISFDSKIKNNGFGKSRLTPDLKYKQSLACQNALLISTNVNTVTEWLMARYIAKTAIYLLCELPDAAGTATYSKKSWYTDTQTKVYYLKGHLDKLRIKMTKGRVYKISFTFKECWA